MKTRPEQEMQEQGGGRYGMAAALLLFLCILAVAFFSYQKSLNPNAGLRDMLQLLLSLGEDIANEAQVQYVFEYDARENPAFAVYGDLIVKCGSGGVWFMDKAGEIIRSENIVLNNPIVKVNGSMLLVADQGTGDIYIMDDRSICWNEKLDAPILNADISRDGYVAVITTAKRDNNEIRVFEPHGIELFRKIIANDFAVSACVSPSAESLVLSAISTGAAGVFSRYKFYDMEGEDIATLSFDTAADSSAELMPLFRYNNDGSLFASGDRAVASIDPAGKLVWEKAFRSVAGTELVGNKQLAVAAEDEKGNLLRIYSADGKELASSSLKGKVKGLNAQKGIIAVNTSDTVYFYDSRCRNLARYSSGSGINQVLLFGRHQAVVVTDREAVVVYIN